MKKQSLESNLLIADVQSLKIAETTVDHATPRSMCEGLSPGTFRDVKKRQFDTDSNNHLLGLSGDRIGNVHKASSLNQEKAVCSRFTINQ